MKRFPNSKENKVHCTGLYGVQSIVYLWRNNEKELFWSQVNLIQAVVDIDNAPAHTLIYDHFIPLRTYDTILHMASFCIIATNRIVLIIWEVQDQRTHGWRYYWNFSNTLSTELCQRFWVITTLYSWTNKCYNLPICTEIGCCSIEGRRYYLWRIIFLVSVFY